MRKLLFIFGTRPEAIKMAPLIYEFRRRSGFDVTVCVTGQHRQLLDQVMVFFEIEPDSDLKLMRDNQSLFDLTAGVLTGLAGVLKKTRPDLIFVQGDTTTAFVGALAGFYARLPVAHVEAGLRSGDKLSPYPEEINRILTGHIADYHFAPTERARGNLEGEGVTRNVWVVGNTVIDALLWGRDIVAGRSGDGFARQFAYLDAGKRTILVTGHRRESFGKPFENICQAVKTVAQRYSDVQIVYPVHLNPNVREPVHRILNGTGNVHLVEPLDYPHLIWLMDRSYLVLTDSGGIQEEAPALGKPVLVMRDVTERKEGIEAGTARLVGTETEAIVAETARLLEEEKTYTKMAQAVNPYGDGTASRSIADIVTEIG